MQIFAAVLLLLPLATASPFLPRQAATNSTTQLTFTGAGASFSVTAPVDGSTFQVRKFGFGLDLVFLSGRTGERNEKAERLIARPPCTII